MASRRDAKGLDDLLRAPELAALDAIAPPFDPLDVLAWTHQERPHTRFLAWLLDPRDPHPGGGHGLGAAVLHALTVAALARVEALPGAAPDVPPTPACAPDPAKVSVVRERAFGDGVRVSSHAPDILCQWRDAGDASWVLLVENKVDADEGDGQVRAYLAWAARHHPDAHTLLVYVTPDGRAPTSVRDEARVVPLRWSEVATAALDAIASTTASPAHLPARQFAVSVLDALRARFGGDDTVRALVETLHDRHPRSAALASSPATEPSLLDTLRTRFPHAAWHLRTLRPHAHRWTRAWADLVAQQLHAMLGTEAPAVIAVAPHAGCADRASWMLDGVTDILALHLFCTEGRAFGSHRPRAWVGLYAPNTDAAALFDRREQRALLDALPDETRAWLLGATPVYEAPGAWRWLAVGTPATLTRAYSVDDDARRTAKALHAQLAPHLEALVRVSRDDVWRLFSCDLDATHAIPHERADRDALLEGARPDAWRVALLTRQPTDHRYELHRACALGASLGASFGGTGALTYALIPFETRPFSASCAVLDLALCHGADDRSWRALVDALHATVREGAWVLLAGAPCDEARLREAMGPWGSPITHIDGAVGFEAEGPELHAEVAGFEALAGRDRRHLGAALAVTLDARAKVAVHAQTRDGWIPLVAGWRVEGVRVLWLAGGLVGPWGAAMQAHPEALARLWRALVAFAETL